MIRKIISYIITAVVAITAFVIFSGDSAKAEYAEAYGYGGSRWKSTSFCVQNKMDNPMLRRAVYDAVHDLNDNTNLRVVNYGSTSCSSYSQIIYATDANYINDSRMAYIKWNDHDWGLTPNQKLSTWITRSGVELRINTRYMTQYPSESTWRHIAIHELGHAIGLDHRTDTCYSVETMKSGCSGSKPTILQTVDKRLINTIYSW